MSPGHRGCCTARLPNDPDVVSRGPSKFGRKALRGGSVPCTPDAGQLCLLCKMLLQPLRLQSSLGGTNASELTNDTFSTDPGANGGRREPLQFRSIQQTPASADLLPQQQPDWTLFTHRTAHGHPLCPRHTTTRACDKYLRVQLPARIDRFQSSFLRSMPACSQHHALDPGS